MGNNFEYFYEYISLYVCLLYPVLSKSENNEFNFPVLPLQLYHKDRWIIRVVGRSFEEGACHYFFLFNLVSASTCSPQYANFIHRQSSVFPVIEVITAVAVPCFVSFEEVLDHSMVLHIFTHHFQQNVNTTYIHKSICLTFWYWYPCYCFHEKHIISEWNNMLNFN